MTRNDDDRYLDGPDDGYDEYDEYAAEDGRYDDDYDDYGEYETVRRPGRRGAPLAVTAIAVFAVLAIVVAVVLVWASRQMNPSGDPGPKVAAVDVPSGATFDDVADLLEKEKVIGSATVFRWYAKFNDVSPVKAGRYVDFEENSSMSDAVDVLNAGPVPPDETVVTIIPGMWLTDALAAIEKSFPAITSDMLKLVLASGQITSKYKPATPGDWKSWEGYLLPETYQFAEDATAQDILQKIVSDFDAVLDDLGYDNAQATTGRSAADLVTIASMVERETGDPDEERPKIARVIFNRLEKGTPLGIDATILYGVGRKGNEGGLTKTELETDGPYNSRLRKGLPPTAISLPSEKSLAAAIAPADGPWIYYVLQTQSPRTHVFTASYKEFEAAKAECRKNGFC